MDKQTDKLRENQTNMTDYSIVAEGAYNNLAILSLINVRKDQAMTWSI